jgi:dienelactone hydrolase
MAVTLSVVALHTLLDTAIAPERGTTATDHLAATIVPLAVIGLIASSYSRLRPGARAGVDAALGAWCLVGATLAFMDARATFERASDWTGFLLAPAGLALLALAVRLLWSTRKGGHYRYARRAGVTVGALVMAYWFAAPVSMALIGTHRPRAAAAEAPSGYHNASLCTKDGLRLAAWYAPSQNGAAVISFPTRSGKLGHAAMLRRHGYGVLMVDMRGYDGSEGSPNAFGWDATKDIDAAVSWLRHQPDVRQGRIGGIGFSVGGETMLQAAAENHDLRAIVSDGAGERSVRDTWLRGLRAALAIPESAVQSVAVAIYSDTVPPPSLKTTAALVAPSAAFFIHAERGIGGEDLNPTYFDAARAPKAIWKVPEAGHTGGLDARPEDYERRVIGFFDRYLLLQDRAQLRVERGSRSGALAKARVDLRDRHDAAALATDGCW